MRAWAWRLAWIGAAAVLIPACKATPTASVLLMDLFNSPTLTTNWTIAGTGLVVRDTGNGFQDSTSMRMSATGGGQAPTANSKAQFNATAMTFSVHMAADTAAPGDVGTGMIVIKDTFASEIASANWDVASGGTLTLKIAGVLPDVVVAAPAPDLTFHRIVFKLTAAGNASWALDNGVTLHSATGVTPILPATLQLAATYPAGTGFALFYFDNVNVTSP